MLSVFAVSLYNHNMNADKILEKLKAMHPDARCELNFETPFQLLVAVILSAQCTDKRVNIVTDELFKKYSTPADFAALSPEELEPLIHSCGFFRNKAQNIILAARAVIERFGGEVPRTMEELLTIPGTGRKTASVVLTVAFGIPAMPVDTHVFRVAHRLALSDGKTPDAVESDLKNEFKPKDWNALHHAMIFHGRYICKAARPACGECALRGECAYYINEKKEA